ncbi:MAG: hypothetical protein ACRDJ3_08310 [Solirubrobacteraceae bacterium]
MMKKPHHQENGPKTIRTSVWDDAEIIIDIQYTKPGTALDDHLRKEQTQAVLDLLADCKRKFDKNGDARP